eukprot:CAMPEP_0172937928 /NCGR_PEP_ID=MMETSP1075-20121228/222769_1 /TAXON_ID=2916 /ORGANISM="Ceratium fusus, Strain PA161109" /LENGTH=122 /DNA_ID=CAMNT_0013799303 /DNA_START=87 /DNA_END=455 /DNA_ORIENTATION=-
MSSLSTAMAATAIDAEVRRCQGGKKHGEMPLLQAQLFLIVNAVAAASAGCRCSCGPRLSAECQLHSTGLLVVDTAHGIQLQTNSLHTPGEKLRRLYAHREEVHDARTSAEESVEDPASAGRC